MVSVSEFKSIFDLIKAFPDEQSCINHLEKIRWNGNVVSPFDESSQVYKCKSNRYKCKNTGKYFNVKVGTIFEDTKIKLQKWFMALFLFSSHKKGISSHQLAKDIDVTQKTAWFMLHRLRYAFDHPNFKIALENEVEIDETFMGGDEKNKHWGKKTAGTQGRSTKTKTPVLGMIERGGNVVAMVVEDTKKATLQPIINENVKNGTSVYTDEWKAYNSLATAKNNFTHQRVNHSAKEYVNGKAHTNGIECFWSHLKRGITGIYHWCSEKHLQRYVNEFSLRFNTRLSPTCNRFDLVLSNIEGRLLYRNLITKI
jgi:transposase-like protein